MTGTRQIKRPSGRLAQNQRSISSNRPQNTFLFPDLTSTVPNNLFQAEVEDHQDLDRTIFSGISNLAISATSAKFSFRMEKNSKSNGPSDEPSSDEPSSDETSDDGSVELTQANQHLQSIFSTQDEETRVLNAQLALLRTSTSGQNDREVIGSPIFTAPVLQLFKGHIKQYGFFAGLMSTMDGNEVEEDIENCSDPRVFFNISAPSSAFICGSQGSGKSHTLSCFIENCLMKSDVSRLDHPLAGLVFHYDTFTNDHSGAPCEAAHLSSNPKIKVRVLCSPTNIETIKRTYAGLNVTIEPLRINESDLNTKRMLDLMAVSPDDGPMPLYLHSINRILRELRIVQQSTNASFNYLEFKQMVENCAMTPAQLSPLNQRLDTLESFMPKSQTQRSRFSTSNMKGATAKSGNNWAITAGTLTIVDLSCPCVTSESACALFNMCLSLFLEQKTSVGRVIALDEAHKYMNSATEATTLTQTLLSSIRLQRHLGTRIFVSTQEPTISPALLDLCSITIVHRFTSPEWLKCLRQHLAALDSDHLELDLAGSDEKSVKTTRQKEIFGHIVNLRVGEALLFAPSAIVGVGKKTTVMEDKSRNGENKQDEAIETRSLGVGYLKIKIRARLTADGGKSVMAN